MHRSTSLRRSYPRSIERRHAYSRLLRQEKLDDRLLLAIDVAFDDGLLSLASDADDDVLVRASGESTQIFGSDAAVPKFPTADITQLNIQTDNSTTSIDITEVTAQDFPNLRQAVFEGGPWVDVDTTEQIITEILGPGWAARLGISDGGDYLETGAWKVPLADGSLATQLTEAGWGNAQGLLDQIVAEVDRNALVRSFSFGSADAAPTFGRLFNGHYDHEVVSHVSAPAAADLFLHARDAADINGDGAVDASDYTLWANTAGAVGDNLAADINGDGTVDVEDYDRLLENWDGVAKEIQEIQLFLDGGEGGGGAPQVLISDPTVDESAGIATFGISLSRSDTTLIAVEWTTAWQTAISPDDFAGATGTAIFNPGETLKFVNVAIADDSWDEAAETFTVNLSNAVNAELLETQGVATILDNDAEPTISISDVTVDEDAGEAVFTVSLSTFSLNTVTVDWSTTDGSAISPEDYTASGPQQITFWPGLAAVPIAIPIVGSGAVEPDETFAVDLTNPVGATIADGQGTATIEDNDPKPGIRIDHITVNETDPVAIFNATLTAGTDKEVPCSMGDTSARCEEGYECSRGFCRRKWRAGFRTMANECANRDRANRRYARRRR